MDKIKEIPNHPESGDDPYYRVVSLASFIAFAMNQESWQANLRPAFLALKDLPDGKQPDLLNFDDDKTYIDKNAQPTIKRRASDIFVAALIRLLVEIAKRAEKSGEQFNVTNMPGQKIDFQEVAAKYDQVLDNKTNRTFDDYIQGLCQFKQGVSRSDFYRRLFPEYYKSTK